MGEIAGQKEWDSYVSAHENVHLLQHGGWGTLKSEFGWRVARVAGEGGGAQILFRPLAFGRTLAYVPKGPIGPDWPNLLPEIDRVCRAHGAIALKVEPDFWEDDPAAARPPEGFRLSRHTIQPPRTIAIDIAVEEDVLLARMKQKTRYNIRLAQRKGVVVRESQDVDTFNDLIQVTGEREAFGVHDPAYYRRVFDLFHPYGQCALLIAEFEQEPLAALMIFTNNQRAWYFYGGSSNLHRNFMATYLLQWEAIRWAKGRGCTEYDLWGIPDQPESVLEETFSERSEGLWGVYRFKRGFGGQVLRSAGPWDRVYSPLMYRLFNWWTSRSG